MNWNLKPISKLCLLIALSGFLNVNVQAQSKSKLSYGLGVNLGLGSAIVGSDAYKTYSDSVKSSTTAHYNKGIHAWLNYSLGKKADLQIGLGFQQVGFARKQTNLQFKNPTYPGIGVGFIEDVFSPNSGREITYNYRFNYIQIPVILNTYLGRSGDFKWVYNFSTGITPQILVKHQLVANCSPGFKIDSKDQFKLDSSGFEARRISTSLQIGMNIEYHDTKEKIYFFQPLIGFYPISVTRSTNSSYPFYFALNVGMLFNNK